MKKHGIGSRLLSLLLVLAMVLPMVPLSAFAAVGDIATATDGNNKIGDTGLVGDKIDNSDTISWPIKIYDFLNDGMLFEFANAAYTGDISEAKGGAYGGGTPAPLFNSEATGTVNGADYTVNSGYAETAYTSWLATYSAFEYTGSLVEAVNFVSPSHLHLVPDGTYTDMKPWVMSDYSADNSTTYTPDAVRYAVVVYRTSGLEDGEAKLNLGWETNLVGSNVYEGYTSVNYDYRGSVNLVANSTQWNYVVIDMKAGTLGTNWNSITKVYKVIADFQMNEPTDSVDISHVAYFDTEFEAIEFGKDAVAFDNDPGEYLNPHTEYIGAGETVPVSKPAPSGNVFDFTIASGSTGTSAAGYTYESGYDQEGYATWTTAQSGRSYIGGVTVTPSGSGTRRYVNVSNSTDQDKGIYAWYYDTGANKSALQYATVVYRTNGFTANDNISFWIQNTKSGAYPIGASLDADAINGEWVYPQTFYISENKWTYLTFDLSQIANADGDYNSMSTVTRVGMYLPDALSSSKTIDIAFIDFYSSSSSATSFGSQAAAFMNGETTVSPGSSYTTDQKQWNTGNNVSFGMLYANQGGGWYSNGDDTPSSYNYISGGSNSEPNGYFNYQIGAFKYTAGNNATVNSIRETARSKGYPVSDTMWLLTDGLVSYDSNSKTDSNGKKYYSMENLSLGYTMKSRLYSGVMTAGLLEAGLITVTDDDGNSFRVPNYKEDAVAYIAYLLRDALAVGKTDANGNYNYNFVAGTANGEQYGYKTDANGNQIPLDLASAIRARLGYTFPNGENGGGKASYTAEIGTYADTKAKAANLIGDFLDVKDNITTFMDAAYYLLMNQFVADSYNQTQDEYQYLVMSKATLETNGKDAYVFDAGFTTGLISETANTQAYRDSSDSAVNYDTQKGTISLTTANSKDQVYFQSTYATTRYPFLPVTDSTGVYAGETKSPYFLDDGNGVMGVAEEGATFVNRNYNYAVVSNGEFVYHAEDGLFFDFEGDDDVWLFLNGELVVDVGSAHSITKVYMDVNDYVTWATGVLAVLDGYSYTYADATAGTDITLTYTAGMSDAKFKMLIEAAWNANYGTVKSKYSTYADFEAELLRAHHLNLVDSAAYNFDFYYMERHGWGANCRIATNIVVTDPTMKTDKTGFQDTDGDKDLDEIPYNGLVDDSKSIMYQFSLTNEGNTKLYKLSFKDANIGMELTYDEGLTTFGDPVVSTFTTTATTTPLSVTGLDGVMNLDGKVYYLAADGTITWTENILDDQGEVTSVETKTATSLTLAAGTHSLVLYQTNSSVLFKDSYARVNIGGVTDNTSNTVDPEAAGGVYALRTGKVNRLLVEGIRVSDANGGVLDVSDLIVTVDGFTSEENYEDYMEALEAGNTTKAESYKIDTITIKLSTNEELKAFLTYLADPAHQTQETDKDGYSGVYNGTGLWRHATVTISGFHYTMTEAEKEAGEFENTVYTYAFGTMTSEKELKGQDTHRVHSVGASYYQWAGHKLTVTSEKLFKDINYTFFIQTEKNGVITTEEKTVTYDKVTFTLCDRAGNGASYDYVKKNGSNFEINYPTADEYTFYVLMQTDLNSDGSYSVGEYCVAPVTVYVTDVEDSVYVLDYGLTTEDLNTDGELFKNDELRGEYGVDVAKLMNVASKEPSYVEALNRISFTKLGFTSGGDISVEDGHFNIDMSIDANTGKKINYSAYTDTYSLTDAGTMRIHLAANNVPSYWTDVYLYFWYDDGSDNSWPGTKMTKQDDGSYVVDIPGDVSNIIINNHPQTSSGTIRVSLANTNIPEDWKNGTVYLYAWNGTGNNGGWPGTEMKKQDDGSYILDIPSDMENVIFNNGSGEGKTQTANLSITAAMDSSIALTGETNSNGRYLAATSSAYKQTVDLFVTPGMTNYVQLTGTANGDKLNASITTNTADVDVYVKAPAGWKAVCLYYWGSVKTTGWKDLILTETKTDENGVVWYTGKMPGDASSVIVHDGDNEYRKTYDLTVTSGLEPWIIVDDEPSNTYTENGRDVYQYNAKVNYSDNNFTVCVGVSAVEDWGTPYLYYWYSDGTSTEMVWPGKPMTYNSENGRYTYEVPVGVHNVIITNESGSKQTENLLFHDFAAGGHADVDVSNKTIGGKYTAVIKEESISFTPDNFMDNSYSMWMAITVHAVDADPTAVSAATTDTDETAININKEVQMFKKITVLPATVVYYEDDFPAIHYAVTPAEGNGAGTTNVFTRIGYSDDKTQSVNQEENYGYDDTYADSTNSEASAGSLTTVKIMDNSQVAYFTFTGTGFELISRTNASDSATLKLTIYKTEDITITDGVVQVKSGKTYIDRYSLITEFDNTADVENDTDTEGINQVPAIRVTDLNKASYTVVINGVPAGIYDDQGNRTGIIPTYLYIDGLRIYQPLGASNSNYNTNENGATFTELRELIAAGKAGLAQSTVNSTEGFTVSTSNVTWTENRNGDYEGNKVSGVNDYLLAGPNNEVYMDNTSVAKSSIVFYVKETGTGAHNLQIAARAIDRGLYYGTGSTGTYAVIKYGRKNSTGYAWSTAARIKTGTEEYYTIPYKTCPTVVKDGVTYYQVVLIVMTASVDNDAKIPGMAAFTTVKTNGLEIVAMDGNGSAATVRNGKYGLEEKASDGKWYGVEYTEKDTNYTVRYNPNITDQNGDVWQRKDGESWVMYKKYVSSEDKWYTYDTTTTAWSAVTATKSGMEVQAVDNYPEFQLLSMQMNSWVESDEEQTETVDQFDISYASMTMGNSLAINFAFEQGKADDWTGYYAEIVKTYADGREDAVQIVPFSEWNTATINGVEHYYVTFNGIAAKEMTDDVNVTIYNADGDAVSNVWTDSVRDQAMRNLANETISELEKTMVVDMLNYGAAAQEYFDYNTSDLATAKLTDEQKSAATESTSYADTHSGSANYYASNLLLKSNIQLMFAFKNVDSSMNAVVAFTNHRGETKTITIDGDQFTKSGSYTVVTVDELVVADGRQNVTCKVYDGNTLVAEATDSVESYAARKSEDGQLFEMLMKFSDSAYAFFHNK